MHLFDLPKEILTVILEKLSYDQVSKLRLVSRRFDQLCQGVLNRGFNKAIRQNDANLKRIKSLLPRRESERRNHVLARHADILASIETRLSMLSMTYGKFMDLNLCCFIPGRVLDEIFFILRLTSNNNVHLRPHEILQELRDISSMAIEHFDDKIRSTLKKAFVESKTKSLCLNNSGTCLSGGTNVVASAISTPSGLGSISFRPMDDEISSVLTKYSYGLMESSINPTATCSGTSISKLRQQSLNQCKCANSGNMCNNASRIHRKILLSLKRSQMECKNIQAKMQRKERLLKWEAKRMRQTLKCLNEYKSEVTELRKRLDEIDAKHGEICANMKHIKPDTNNPDSNIKSSPSRSSNIHKDVEDNTRDNNNDEVAQGGGIDSLAYSTNLIPKKGGKKRSHFSDGNDDNESSDNNNTSKLIKLAKP